jgi:gamma-glutamyltranspeptidase/glutathione hydrolase
MVSTQHYLATQAGVEMLEDGGNAIDAAVAAAFALGVCEPAASGLGGQTMALVRSTGKRGIVALDGSSRAPHRAVPGLLKQRERLRGHAATTVPSTPAVLADLLERYGTMPLARVLEPSIRFADEGVPVSELLHGLMLRERKHLRVGSAARFLLVDGSKTPRIGHLLKQPVLAGTYRRLADSGVLDFYQGEIARLMAADIEAHGGLLRLDDLAQVPHPVERRPLSCNWEGARVFTFPPPGAGRMLVQMLKVLQEFPERLRDPDRSEGALVVCETIRQANKARRDRPRDPQRYAQAAEHETGVTSSLHARRVARRISRAMELTGETTHLSTMDKAGNVVSLTQSIERVFGSFEASPELGFLYNNYMSCFVNDEPAHPYALRPNAAPWASVAPTIVMKGRKPWLAIGSPGSERIATAILMVLLRLSKAAPIDAVSAPRLHCRPDGRVSLEVERFRDDIPRTLVENGYELDEREAYSFYLGCVQMVMREGRELVGVADPRRDGAAGGPK